MTEVRKIDGNVYMQLKGTENPGSLIKLIGEVQVRENERMPAIILLDEGAVMSIITEGKLREWGVIDQVRDKCFIDLIFGNGTQLRQLGTITLNLVLGGKTYACDLRVVTDNSLNIPADLLLANNFASKYNIVTESKPRRVWIENVEIPLKCLDTDGTEINAITSDTEDRGHTEKSKVSGRRETYIEPWTTGAIELRVRSRYPFSSNTAMFHPFCGVLEASIMCPGIIQVPIGAKTGTFKGYFVNASPNRILINKNTKLGTTQSCMTVPINENMCDRQVGKKGMSEGESKMSGVLSGDLDKPISHHGINTVLNVKDKVDKLYEIVDSLFPDHQSKENKVLKTIVEQIPQVFVLEDDPFSVTPYYCHEIVTTDQQAVFTRPYQIPIYYLKEVEDQIQNMLEQGLIRPSRSPYNSPIVPVKKRDGGLRLCLDFRKLNTLIKDDRFPLPRINEILAQLGKSQYFSCLDLRKGYHQVPLTESSKEKTAFSVPGGHYEFNVIPFGLKDAPSAFQRIVTSVMTGLTGNSVQIYLDDIVVTGDTWEKHVENLIKVLKRLAQAQLTLQLQKCHFFKKEVDFLGHQVSTEGIKPQPGKVSDILNIPRPETVHALQSFLGFINYYKKFIDNYSELASPLYELLKGIPVKKKNSAPLGIWTDDQVAAFNKLKEKISYEVTLTYPDFQKPFVLNTDASQIAIGGVLQQRDEDGELRPITFFSRTLNRAEQNYSTIEREALGIIWGLQANRSLILGFPVEIMTDHRPLVWILEKSHPNSRIARRQILVSEYNIVTKHIPGKKNTVADFLSRVRMQCITEDKVLHISNRVASVITLPDISTEWNKKILQKDQSVHPLYGRLKYLIERDRLTEMDKTDKEQTERKLKCSINDLIIEDDLLCIKRINSNKPIVIVPENRIKIALNICHSTLSAGHGGVKATLDRLNKLCYWPGMNEDVKEYVRGCEVCQRFKPINEPPAPLLNYPSANWPFARVHMDLIGPLNTSTEGYKYILTCVDACTRYLVAGALRSKNADEVVEAFLKEFVCKHGVPEWLVTDNGSEFLNEKFKGLTEAIGMTHTQVTAYHPSANGIVERVNGTVVQILRTLTEDNPHIWCKMLGFAVLAYNTAINRVTEESPYYCLYLKDPKLPYDLIASPMVPSYNVDNTKEQVIQMMQACYQRCQEKTEENQKYEQRRQAPKSKIKQVQVGDKVYAKNIPRKGLSKKLQPKYSGPWRVHKKISDVVLILKHVTSGKQCKIHTDRVRLAYESMLHRTDNGNVGRTYPLYEKGEEITEGMNDSDRIVLDADDRVTEDVPSESESIQIDLTRTRPSSLDTAHTLSPTHSSHTEINSHSTPEHTSDTDTVHELDNEDNSSIPITETLQVQTRYPLRSRVRVDDLPLVMERPIEYE